MSTIFHQHTSPDANPIPLGRTSKSPGDANPRTSVRIFKSNSKPLDKMSKSPGRVYESNNDMESIRSEGLSELLGYAPQGQQGQKVQKSDEPFIIRIPRTPPSLTKPPVQKRRKNTDLSGMQRRSCEEKCGINGMTCNITYIPDGSECQGAWTIKARTGAKSVYGQVYLVEGDNNKETYVIKTIPYNEEDPIEKENLIYKEIELQNMAAELGVAPSILQVVHGNGEIGIIMQGLSYTLGDYATDRYKKLSRSKNAKKQLKIATDLYHALEKCSQLLDTLHDNLIFHKDAHLSNFMADADGRWYIIDFGLADTEFEPEDIVLDYDALDTAVSKLFETCPELQRTVCKGASHTNRFCDRI